MELGLRGTTEIVETQLGQGDHHRTFFQLPRRTCLLCSCLPGHFFVTVWRMAAHQPSLQREMAQGWEPPSPMHALASLPERGGTVLLHTMPRTGVPSRGVVARPWTVLFYLPGAHTHHR